MDPRDLRADIPVLEDIVYLNTGAGSPCPNRVIEAASDCLRYTSNTGPQEGMYAALGDRLDESREAMAEFLGARASEIALTQSTADGIARIASALPWQEGDKVVRPDFEHVAGKLPWQWLQESHGIEVEVIETSDGRLGREATKAAIEGADLLFLSSLTWTHGTRIPVEQFVDLAHDAGARVFVDAVQAPGQMDINVDEWGADFVVGASHKWLLGPWGAGFTYVRDGAEQALEPRQVNYWTVSNPTGAGDQYKDSAQRLDVGTMSPAPHAGAQEAIAIINELGIDTIKDHIARLSDRLKDGVGEEALLSPREFESGLVTFRVDDAETAVSKLDEAGVQIRSVPLDDAVRASVHVFNTADDIDALLSELDRQNQL